MSLRAERQEETRQRLIEVGAEMFGAQGYAATPAQAIVERCGLTRGALYHHFPEGKKGLFVAVNRKLQNDLMTSLAANRPDHVPTLRQALGMYFDAASDPVYRQVVLIDGPTVMSFDDWNEGEYDIGLDLIGQIVLLPGIRSNVAEIDQNLLAELLFPALGQAALILARAADPEATKQRLLTAFEAMLSS